LARRYRIGLVAAAAVVIGIAVAVWYRRPIRDGRLVGIDWRVTIEGSKCAHNVHDLWCTTDSMPARIWVPHEYTTLQMNRITRSVQRYSRYVELDDSTRWTHLVDSVRHVMSVRHAEPLPCDTAETRFHIAQAWDVGPGEARLYAARIPARRSESQYWYISIQLVPHASAGCGPTWRYVRLTPEQEWRRVEEWIAEQLGE